MEQNLQRAEALMAQLAPEQLEAVVHLMEVMLDPVARAIANAPTEDEEIAEEFVAALDAAHESIQRGEGIPHEEILRQYGLTPR